MRFRNLPKEKWREMEVTVRMLKLADIKIQPKKGRTDDQRFYSEAYKLVMKNK